MSELSPLQYAHQHRERFLSELAELLSIPSISTLPEHQPDIRRAAEWLAVRLRSFGVQAELVGDESYPLVYGEWLGAPGAPTLLLYGHYDVQPVDPIELWSSAPFEPEVRGGNIYARGASDDKGQTMTMVDAAECFLRTTGTLPVNVKFLLEGQEEYGSTVIKRYVDEHSAQLDADAVQIADSGMFAPGIPTIDTGLRGIVYTEIRARGASHDLHSGLYGGVAPNPANGLAHVIAGLKDVNGHITIPGFYDAVEMPNEEIRASWRALPGNDQTPLHEELGASALAGESEFTTLERRWARPTLDVNGILSGFTGAGAKTVIPAEGTAKVSMRIVPNQRADEIFELFRRRVLELAPPGIELEVVLLHGDDPVLVPSESHFIEAAGRALEETFGRPAVLGRSGGSIPIVGVFKEALGLNSVLMGWGLPDDNLHAPNEKFSIENFYNGIDATIRFWDGIGSRTTG
jgi:acetylornithine deacetylase/succinyl-diaminopimelate desuccinylase-like protein